MNSTGTSHPCCFAKVGVLLSKYLGRDQWMNEFVRNEHKATQEVDDPSKCESGKRI